MVIIIPAAGAGTRFVDAGYNLPKPLIPVMGEPMIAQVVRSLKTAREDRIYVVYTQDLERYQFQSVLRKMFYGLDLNFVPLKVRTRGPAETVLCALNQMDDLDEQVLVADCDTFYTDDIVKMARQQVESCIFYFEDRGQEPLFSYLRIGPGQQVAEIQEKVRISNNACTGAYSFCSGHLLKKYCEQVLDGGIRSRNEFYISNIYSRMLQCGETVRARRVDEFVCLGTPRQLQTYCSTHGAAPKRFCFDLDGTLVTFPDKPGDYKNVRPIARNIRFVQYLHAMGHTIIIATARKMLSSGHNPGKAARNAYQDLFATLERFKIPFDEIYFGKPMAHFYIDDLSVRPWEMEKETGFYDTRVEPRHFNHIEYHDGQVIKTTSNPGEIYWYRHIPENVRDLFPRAEIDGSRLVLERIDGIVFSYLLINNSLTRANIGKLLENVARLHGCLPAPDEKIDYSANYGPKMAERYQAYDYSSVSAEAACTFQQINGRLQEHVPYPGVVHGDLVFSNVFLCDDQKIRWIDMRGRVGATETIFGDIFYDYAKIYQSLTGYDFILNDCEPNETYLAGLREYFEECFVRTFSPELLETLKTLTACLLFSLIPLHQDPDKQRKYFSLLRKIIRDI